MTGRLGRWGVVSALGLAACGGEGPASAGGPPPGHTPLLPDAGFLISDAGPSLISSFSGSSVYVSLRPGTVPAGVRATLRYPFGRTDVTMPSGGFDPVEVPAATGDTVIVEVYDLASQRVAYLRDLVRPTRPPIIVRTEPPPRKVDVPLNMRMIVVFSEPVEPGSVTGASIRLRRDTTLIPATVHLSPDGLSAELVPDVPLEPRTNYVLEVTDQVRDRNGQALADPAAVPFTTEFTGPLPDGALVLAFARNDIITTSTLNGTEVKTLYSYGTEPEWSPDGRRLAFACAADATGGYGDICRIDADGANNLRLTPGPYFEQSPTWSPDGRQIAFISRDCTAPFRYGEPDCGPPYLGRMNADGTALSLIPFPPQVWHAYDLAWSPDGTRFAFACNVSVKSAGGRLFSDLDICTMRTDFTDLRQLTELVSHESHPVWSPDGRQILFQVGQPFATSGVEHPYSLAVMDAVTGTMRQVPNVFGQYASWSPDGTRIVFASYSSLSTGSDFGNDYGLWTVNADGTGALRVTTWGDRYPVWRR